MPQEVKEESHCEILYLMVRGLIVVITQLESGLIFKRKKKGKYIMKKIITMILAGVILCTLCACSGTKEEKKVEEEKTVTKTDYITVDALCIDDDYRDADNSSLRLVYLFYTIRAYDNDSITLNSEKTKLRIGENTYTAKLVPDACKYAPSYMYGNDMVGFVCGFLSEYDSAKIAVTFEIPESEFASKKIIKVEDEGLPDADKLCLKTNEVTHCAGIEEIGKVGDPEGYAELQKGKEEADAETTTMVETYLVNKGKIEGLIGQNNYTIDFGRENDFTVGVNGIEYTGTYTVRNASILCTYPSGVSFEIPYEIKDGTVHADILMGLISVKHG